MTPDDFLREYETSGRTGGVERTLSLIDDDAVYWFSDGSAHVGRTEIERALRRNAELIQDETYGISEVVWLAESPDVAACTYRFDWSGTVRGAQASGSGRGTCVLSRRGASWVVVHEHLSKGPTSA
jgi:ketosteroid isomerase-like protein